MASSQHESACPTDANLNGEFNTADLVYVFQSGIYEDGIPENAGCATGDWNGDADFDSGDLVVAFPGGGFEQGPSRNTSAVPEPSSAVLFLVGLLALPPRTPSSKHASATFRATCCCRTDGTSWRLLPNGKPSQFLAPIDSSDASRLL